MHLEILNSQQSPFGSCQWELVEYIDHQSFIDEVIGDIIKNKDLMRLIEEVLELMEQIRSDDPHYQDFVKCAAVNLAIVRRFGSSNNFRKVTVERFLKFVFMIPPTYGEEIKKSSETHSFLLKEYAGFVGVIALDSIE
jgi:hypothetical protein